MSIPIGYKDWKGNPTNPNPKQEEAFQILKRKDTEVLAAIGGTRSGKTSFAIYAPISLAMEQPGQDWLLGHKTWIALRGSLIQELKNQVPHTRKSNNEYLYFDEETKEEYLLMTHSGHEMSYTVTIPGFMSKSKGYTIKFYYRPLDPKKNLPQDLAQSGMTLNGVVLDQFELLDYEAWMAAFTRVSHDPRKIILTMNPPDLRFGKPWFWDFLMDDVKKKEHPGWERRKIVHMKPSDNAYISKDYERGLSDNLSTSDAARMRDGQIASAQGLVYPELNASHIVKALDKIPNGAVIQEISDWGFVDGAVTQWYVRMPETKKWRLWDYIHAQEKRPEEYGQLLLEKRVELMTAGRKADEPLPRFIVSYWGRDIFSNNSSGQMVSRQFMAIPAHKGQKLIPVRVSNAGFNTKTGIIHSQVMCGKEMLANDEVEISEICADFFEQHGMYFFKEDSEEPHEFRVKAGVDRKIKHHFEQMVCFRMFAWVTNAKAEYSDGKRVMVDHNIPAHEFQSAPKNMYNPLARFTTKMNRVERAY